MRLHLAFSLLGLIGLSACSGSAPASTATSAEGAPANPSAAGRSPAHASGVLRVDGTSDAALDASLDAMRAGMSPREIEAFTDALLRVGSRRSAAVLRASNGDLGAVNRALREDLDGKSVAEILAEGAAR